eukprot:XP_001697465.1 predicted protein [Chlamydomonas reinhardtii]
MIRFGGARPAFRGPRDFLEEHLQRAKDDVPALLDHGVPQPAFESVLAQKQRSRAAAGAGSGPGFVAVKQRPVPRVCSRAEAEAVMHSVQPNAVASAGTATATTCNRLTWTRHGRSTRLRSLLSAGGSAEGGRSGGEAVDTTAAMSHVAFSCLTGSLLLSTACRPSSLRCRLPGPPAAVLLATDAGGSAGGSGDGGDRASRDVTAHPPRQEQPQRQAQLGFRLRREPESELERELEAFGPAAGGLAAAATAADGHVGIAAQGGEGVRRASGGRGGSGSDVEEAGAGGDEQQGSQSKRRRPSAPAARTSAQDRAGGAGNEALDAAAQVQAQAAAGTARKYMVSPSQADVVAETPAQVEVQLQQRQQQQREAAAAAEAVPAASSSREHQQPLRAAHLALGELARQLPPLRRLCGGAVEDLERAFEQRLLTSIDSTMHPDPRVCLVTDSRVFFTLYPAVHAAGLKAGVGEEEQQQLAALAQPGTCLFVGYPAAASPGFPLSAFDAVLVPAAATAAFNDAGAAAAATATAVGRGGSSICSSGSGRWLVVSCAAGSVLRGRPGVYGELLRRCEAGFGVEVAERCLDLADVVTSPRACVAVWPFNPPPPAQPPPPPAAGGAAPGGRAPTPPQAMSPAEAAAHKAGLRLLLLTTCSPQATQVRARSAPVRAHG